MTAGGAIRAARASTAIRSSVDVTVACSVVVPTRVIATGVSGARRGHQRGGDVTDLADGREQHQRASVGVLGPVDLVAAGHHGDLAVVLRVSGIPAYAGTALTEETPGRSRRAMPALTQAWASSGPEA